MNTIRISLALVLLAALPTAAEVSEDRVWTERYEVTAVTPRLSISNIWGSVRVRSGDDGEIRITAAERRSAPDRELLDRSREMLRVNTLADTAGVSIVVGGRDHWAGRRHCRDCRVALQFEVIVPRSTFVDVATVQDGKIDVAGIDGGVSASNVNGPIKVDGINNCGRVENVNGGIDLTFAVAPGADCSIETINGDVVLKMPSGSGLDISLDIFNGDVVSEFATDSFDPPIAVFHDQKDGANRYRIQQTAGLRLEGGGPTFSISSMNGDIRIQKN